MVYTNLITHFMQHSYQNFTIGYIFIGNSDKGKFYIFLDILITKWSEYK